MRTVSVGQALFAATLILVGGFGLAEGDFAGMWDGVPKGFPARELLPYLCALVSLAAGIGLLWPRTAEHSARGLLIYLAVWTLLFKGRFVLMQPLTEGTYQSLGENAMLLAAIWVLYASLAAKAGRKAGFATGAPGVRLGRVLYALAMIAFGLSHFAYLDLTAPLVPGWLPWHVAWAYLTGAAYLAAAAAMLSGVWARLAATLSVAQMGGFTLLVWAPMAMARHLSAFQRNEFVLSWALTAGGWVVAESYRGTAWLAFRKR